MTCKDFKNRLNTGFSKSLISSQLEFAARIAMKYRMLLKPNDTILFYGDSITDAGRNKTESSDLGRGYVYLTSALLQSRFPQLKLTCINRGIGGNKVKDLEDRLEPDALALKPTLVSIMIGINNSWHRYNKNPPQITSFEDFHATYERMLERLSRELNPRFVIMEPFLLHIPADRAVWREDLDPKIHAIRDLARKYRATYIPLDGIFNAKATTSSLEYWAPDGVHPSPAGHALIAEEWLKAVVGS
jgi:acyl-CoA thioesterase I